MNKIAIVADATCDLKEEFQKKYDIIVLPGHVTLPDRTEVKSSPNWDVISREELFASLKKNPESYATSPTNVAEFAAEFERLALEGYDIIALTISSGISGAYGFASSAKKEVQSRYPDVKIECVDSMRFGPGFGLMAVYSAILRNNGSSFEDIVDFLNKNKNRFHQAGWLDDLSFVAKKGRITHAKAFFGTLAGIKPIGEFDYNGLTTVIGKVKGAKAAYETLLNYIENTIENPSEQIIFIAHTNRLPQAEEYKRLIEEKFRPKEIYVSDVYPICGINIGPGLMAAYYIGKPISDDLSREREIITKFTEER